MLITLGLFKKICPFKFSPCPLGFGIKVPVGSRYLLPLFIEKKKSNLRCAIPVCGTSKQKYFMQKAKFRKIIKPCHICLTCYICHLLSPDIKYVRPRHKTKFLHLTLVDFRHCKIYVKPLAHLRHLTRQATENNI